MSSDDRWTLRAADRALLGNKTGATRLGFAVPLKLFQAEGRFPRRPEDVPAAAIGAIAGPVGVAAAAWSGYDWRGRTVEYHRAQVRAALGFREATLDDAEALGRWLEGQALILERRSDQLLAAGENTGPAYRRHLQTVIHNSYRSHYRRMLPLVLDALSFQSNNQAHRPVLDALGVIARHAARKMRCYPAGEAVPLDGVVPAAWRNAVLEEDARGRARVNRIAYEICALQALREQLRCGPPPTTRTCRAPSCRSAYCCA